MIIYIRVCRIRFSHQNILFEILTSLVLFLELVFVHSKYVLFVFFLVLAAYRYVVLLEKISDIFVQDVCFCNNCLFLLLFVLFFFDNVFHKAQRKARTSCVESFFCVELNFVINCGKIFKVILCERFF